MVISIIAVLAVGASPFSPSSYLLKVGGGTPTAQQTTPRTPAISASFVEGYCQSTEVMFLPRDYPVPSRDLVFRKLKGPTRGPDGKWLLENTLTYSNSAGKQLLEVRFRCTVQENRRISITSIGTKVDPSLKKR